MPKHTTIHLTARASVGPYQKGQHIEEASEVEAILAGEHRHHFVRVAADPEAAPALPPPIGGAQEIEE